MQQKTNAFTDTDSAAEKLCAVSHFLFLADRHSYFWYLWSRLSYGTVYLYAVLKELNHEEVFYEAE